MVHNAFFFHFLPFSCRYVFGSATVFLSVFFFCRVFHLIVHLCSFSFDSDNFEARFIRDESCESILVPPLKQPFSLDCPASLSQETELTAGLN